METVKDLSKKRNEYDVIVVGSGCGGATVAREMALKGKKVLLCERGGNWTWLGNSLGISMITQWKPLVMSRQGRLAFAASNYGGASVIAAGAAAPPPKAIFDKVGIDLTEETAEARKDLWIDVLPDSLVGKTNFRLLEAGNELGMKWTKLERFVDSSKCVPNCSECMLGCSRGAKWSGRVYGDEACRHGADLALHTRISDVIVENGKAVGVKGTWFHRSGLRSAVEFRGKQIVLSAGVGNVKLLRRAGVPEAGTSFAVDWLQFVGGVIPGMNTVHEGSMTVCDMEFYEKEGIIIVPVFPNWFITSALAMLKGPWNLPWMRHFSNSSGIMVKIQDELAGKIYTNNNWVVSSKTITKRDKAKLEKGVDICKRVLKKAGAKESTLKAFPVMGAHPSATCRIGSVVDNNLQTSIKNLYCCDASVVPEALGLPVVWTVVTLGKRLAKHLAQQKV